MVAANVDALLALVSEAGLKVYLHADGAPRLTGPRERLTEELLISLKAHREGIIQRLQPKATRRVVLLAGERDSAVEKVLEECSPQGHRDRVRHWAQQHPGRTVAAEWFQKTHCGEEWKRFLWMTWPAAEESCEKATANFS